MDWSLFSKQIPNNFLKSDEFSRQLKAIKNEKGDETSQNMLNVVKLSSEFLQEDQKDSLGKLYLRKNLKANKPSPEESDYWRATLNKILSILFSCQILWTELNPRFHPSLEGEKSSLQPKAQGFLTKRLSTKRENFILQIWTINYPLKTQAMSERLK